MSTSVPAMFEAMAARMYPRRRVAGRRRSRRIRTVERDRRRQGDERRGDEERQNRARDNECDDPATPARVLHGVTQDETCSGEVGTCRGGESETDRDHPEPGCDVVGGRGCTRETCGY